MASSDRWTFLAEWKDPFSSVHWKFHLFFYPTDETIEMFDLLKHRLFLRRTKCEGISMEDLFVGATLRICSRLVLIKDYGDSVTRTKFESICQKTCGFLRPEVKNKKGEILKIFKDKNLKVINIRTVMLNEIEAYEVFSTHHDETILKSVIEHSITEPIVAFQLLGPDAVTKLLDLVGPENPADSKTHHPESLRAIYGIDKIRNAIHVSASPESTIKDFNLLFSKKPFAYMKNTMCCVIKPHAVKEGKVGDIINMIEEFGYEVTGLYTCTLSVEQAEKFHEIYKYVLPEYQAMAQELCSGSCIALEVRGQSEKESFSNFRELMGPLDLEAAKILRPNSLRAKFGKSKIQNAVHVTDLEEDAVDEVEYFFRYVC